MYDRYMDSQTETSVGKSGAVEWLGVHHSGFIVSDLERSVAWYTQALGLELVARQRNDNEYTRRILALGDAVLEIAFLAAPSAASRRQMIELIEYREPRGRQLPVAASDVGAGHVALEVADLDAAYKCLRERGVEFRNPPVEISEGKNVGAWACYLADPDGITVELMQPPRGGWH